MPEHQQFAASSCVHCLAVTLELGAPGFHSPVRKWWDPAKALPCARVANITELEWEEESEEASEA